MSIDQPHLMLFGQEVSFAFVGLEPTGPITGLVFSGCGMSMVTLRLWQHCGRGSTVQPHRRLIVATSQKTVFMVQGCCGFVEIV